MHTPVYLHNKADTFRSVFLTDSASRLIPQAWLTLLPDRPDNRVPPLSHGQSTASPLHCPRRGLQWSLCSRLQLHQSVPADSAAFSYGGDPSLRIHLPHQVRQIAAQHLLSALHFALSQAVLYPFSGFSGIPAHIPLPQKNSVL